jgi:hypothetical protein
LVLESARFRKLFSISREAPHLPPVEGYVGEQCCGSREAGDLIGIEGHDFSVSQYGLPDENDLPSDGCEISGDFS